LGDFNDVTVASFPEITAQPIDLLLIADAARHGMRFPSLRIDCLFYRRLPVLLPTCSDSF